MTAVMACPLCSNPPHHVERPWITRGQRSGKFMILGCPHLVQLFPGQACASDSPEALAQTWASWCTKALETRLAAYPPGSPFAVRLTAAVQPSVA